MIRSLIRLFTDNWGIKLLAFILAVVVYFVMRSPDAPALRGDALLNPKGPAHESVRNPQ